MFCVINPTLGNGQRTWYADDGAACTEAINLMTGKKVYRGYSTPPVLFVVQIVAVIEHVTNTRRKPVASDFLTVEERLERPCIDAGEPLEVDARR